MMVHESTITKTTATTSTSALSTSMSSSSSISFWDKPRSYFQLAASSDSCRYAKTILHKIRNNTVIRLELDHFMIYGCEYTELVRAISINTSIKVVTIAESFLDPLTEDKACILLELIGTLSQLESITIHFPKQQQQQKQQQEYENNNSTFAMMYSALKKNNTKKSKLKHIEIHGLKLEKKRFQVNASSNSSNGSTNSDNNELCEVFHEGMANLRTIRFFDLSVSWEIDAAPFLESLHLLPNLHELEIHMVEERGLDMDSCRSMPDRFFHFLFQSESLRSLILWNMEIDVVQSSHIFSSLERDDYYYDGGDCDNYSCYSSNTNISGTAANNNIDLSTHSCSSCCTLQRLEFRKCDIGPTFPTLLQSMILTNQTLQTLVISQVDFYGSSVSKLLRSLKRNKTLQHLRLMPINTSDDGFNDKDAQAVCYMMKHNESLKSITFHSDNTIRKDDKCMNNFWDIYGKLEHSYNSSRTRRSPSASSLSRPKTLSGYSVPPCA